MTYAFLKTLSRGNHCASLVEAVGIEEVAVRRVLRIDRGITRTTRVGRPDRSPVEPGLKDIFGTNVPRILTQDELLAKIRAALDAGIISDDYAHTLTDLVEILAEESR